MRRLATTVQERGQIAFGALAELEADVPHRTHMPHARGQLGAVNSHSRRARKASHDDVLAIDSPWQVYCT